MIHVPLASSNDQITASLIAPILPSEIKDFLEEVDQPEACLGFITLYVRWMLFAVMYFKIKFSNLKEIISLFYLKIFFFDVFELQITSIIFENFFVTF
ncbi:hypothetical protein ACJX0J_020966, partial [Zea mays]